jgi:hypothetical protein
VFAGDRGPARDVVLLNAGGDAIRQSTEYYQRYSGVTTEVAKASGEFNDTLDKINLLANSFATNLVAQLLPSMKAVADEFLRMKEEGSGFAIVGQAIRVVFETIAVLADNVIFVLKGIGREIGAVAAQAAALSRLDLTGFRAISDAVKADGVRARAELDALERRILGIAQFNPDNQSAAESRRLGLTGPTATGGRRGPAPRLPGGGAAGAGGRASPARTERDEEAAFRAKLGRDFAIEQGERVNAENAALQIERERELLEVTQQRFELARNFAIEEGERVIRENEAYQARLQSLSASTEASIFKRQQEDLEFLQGALQRGSIDLDTYAASVRKLYDDYTEKAADAKSIGEELGLTFSSAFEDAIVGGGKLSDVLKGLEQDILRIVTRKLVTEPLGNALTGMIGGGGSGGGIGGFFSGIFGKLFSADGGGYTGTGPRTGGLDGRGGRLGLLHPNETVVDHSRGQAMPGASRTLNLTINPPAGMSGRTSNQFAADVARQLGMADRRFN